MTFVNLQNVSLELPIYNVRSFSLRHSFVNLATGGRLKSKENQKNVVMVSALKNISFSLEHGDRLGLIGHNGAGKTTLLKLLAGIYTPTSGTLQVEGSISTLFDILLGVFDDITGSENLYISTLIRGKSSVEAKRALKSMEDFTELGNYLQLPMRTYSAGMKVRIGFAAATEGNPDILLVDEVFGAGDKNFIDKSIKRLTSLIERAGILVFSSHSEDLLKTMCNKVAILEHGELRAIGPIAETLDYYKKSIA